MRAPPFAYRSFGLALLTALGFLAAACDGSSPAPCGTSTPRQVQGKDTGYARCETGTLHRPTVEECPVAPAPAGCSAESECRTHADCNAQPNGICTGSCTCAFGCVRDSDCQAGHICACQDLAGVCTPASCTKDSDCAEGLCALTRPGGCGNMLAPALFPEGSFACQTADDECAESQDCGESATCQIEGATRVCHDEDPEVTCGRPFLVLGDPRTAPIVERGDWLAPALLPVESHAELADGWLRTARMERASIAAFARFTMQLLSLGAPAELVEASQRAMGDEIRHARVAYALASAYAGRPLGPGPLAVDHAMTDLDAESILRLTFREGCVGETIAAVEAHEDAAAATDPVVRDVLTGIARDELRHAELAWRFVAWMLERDPGLAGVLREELALAVRSGGDARRRSVLREAVSPVARALLAA